MQLIVLVPRVLRDYVAQLPEVQRNAYNYFNYDHRVVEERVPRGDYRAPYKNADDFTNSDYDSLVSYAKTIVNPVLAKYSARVANEDAMNIAIRSFDNGLFDGKVNANKFEVLVNAMAEQEMQPLPQPAQQEMQPVVMAAMKSKKKEKPSKPVTRTVLKQLGLEPHKVPLRSQIRRKIQKGIPHLVRNPGKGVMVEK